MPIVRGPSIAGRVGGVSVRDDWRARRPCRPRRRAGVRRCRRGRPCVGARCGCLHALRRAAATPPAERSAVALVYWSSNRSPWGGLSRVSRCQSWVGRPPRPLGQKLPTASAARAGQTIHSVIPIRTIAPARVTRAPFAALRVAVWLYCPRIGGAWQGACPRWYERRDAAEWSLDVQVERLPIALLGGLVGWCAGVGLGLAD